MQNSINALNQSYPAYNQSAMQNSMRRDGRAAPPPRQFQGPA